MESSGKLVKEGPRVPRWRSERRGRGEIGGGGDGVGAASAAGGKEEEDGGGGEE